MRALVFLLLAGCMAKSKPVRMPDGREAQRIECNYTLDNCKRKARQLCNGSYDEVASRGDVSCHDCGGRQTNGEHQFWRPRDSNDPHLESNVWKGVLYVRCR